MLHKTSFEHPSTVAFKYSATIYIVTNKDFESAEKLTYTKTEDYVWKMGTRHDNPGDSPPDDDRLSTRALRPPRQQTQAVCHMCGKIILNPATNRMETRFSPPYCMCQSSNISPTSTDVTEASRTDVDLEPATVRKKPREKHAKTSKSSTELSQLTEVQSGSFSSSCEKSEDGSEVKHGISQSIEWSTELPSTSGGGSEKDVFYSKQLQTIDIPSMGKTKSKKRVVKGPSKPSKESESLMQVTRELVAAISNVSEHEVCHIRESSATESSTRVTRSMKTIPESGLFSSFSSSELGYGQFREKSSEDITELYVNPVASTSHDTPRSPLYLQESYEYSLPTLREEKQFYMRDTETEEEEKETYETSEIESHTKTEENVLRTLSTAQNISSQIEAPKTPDVTRRLKKNKTRHVCPICQKTFGSPGKLTQHMYSHTGERPFKCTQCQKAFSSKFKLVRHVLIHSDERKYKCTICERMFHRKDHLKNHVKVHNPIKKTFTCEKAGCGKEYSSFLSYRKHAAVHAAEEGILDCRMCGKSFGTKEEIVYHLKVHAGSRTVKNPSDKKYRCDYCERHFFTRKDVRRHLVVHTGKRDFLCQFCPQRFGRKDHLVRHIKKSHHGGVARNKGKRQRSQTSTSTASTSAPTPVSTTSYALIQPAPSTAARKLVFLTKLPLVKNAPFSLGCELDSDPCSSTSEIQLITFESEGDASHGLQVTENIELASTLEGIFQTGNYDQSRTLTPSVEVKTEDTSVHHQSEPVIPAEELVPSLMYHHPPPPYPSELQSPFKIFDPVKVEPLQFPNTGSSIDLSHILGLIQASDEEQQSHITGQEPAGRLLTQQELESQVELQDIISIESPSSSERSVIATDQLLQLMEGSEGIGMPEDSAADIGVSTSTNIQQTSSSSDNMGHLISPNEDPLPNTPLPGFNQAFHQ